MSGSALMESFLIKVCVKRIWRTDCLLTTSVRFIAPWDCNLVWYYQQTYDKVKSHGGQVLMNPGAPSSECFMAVGDIHLNAESDYDSYVNSYGTPLVNG